MSSKMFFLLQFKVQWLESSSNCSARGFLLLCELRLQTSIFFTVFLIYVKFKMPSDCTIQLGDTCLWKLPIFALIISQAPVSLETFKPDLNH